MKEKEEKLFDEFLEKQCNFISNDKMSGIFLKNWITEHDKREKERLIKEILDDSYFYAGISGIWANGKIGGNDFEGLYNKFKEKIINKYK